MKPIRLSGFLPSPLRWPQLLGWLLHAGQSSSGIQPPTERVQVVRIGAAGTAYPAALREEHHRGRCRGQ